MSDELMHKLEERLGPLHARQRLEIEKDHEAQVFGQGLTFFHLENWYSAPAIIRTILKLTGLYWRAQRNAGMASHVTQIPLSDYLIACF
jgi:hypothetical protein